MKKKTILAAAVALATASAMTFAPVSYKVIDKAYAAGPQDHTDKATAVQKLKDVYGQLNVEGNEELASAYTALLAEAKLDIAYLDIANDLPKLAAKLGSNITDVQEALIAFFEQVIDDYGVEAIDNLEDVSEDFETALADLNGALNAAGLTGNITTDDAAKLLLALEDALLAKSSTITSSNLVEIVLDTVVEFAEEQWEVTPANGIVAVLKSAYDSVADFQSDIDTFKDRFNDKLD